MIHSDFAAHRNSTASRDSFDDEDRYSFSSSVAGEAKTPRRSNAGAGTSSRRFRCLSTIGLPKRPDTKFRKQDFSGRLKSSISRRCQTRQSGPLFTCVTREGVLNGKRGNNSLKIYDPGSPDVSCLGRIKLKQKEVKGLGGKLKSLTSSQRENQPQTQFGATEVKQRQRFSWLKKWFSSRKKVDDCHRAAAPAPVAAFECKDFSPRDWDADEVEIERNRVSCASCPPSLAQMKRFTSQREPQALSDFSADDYDVEDFDDSQVQASEKAAKFVEEGEDVGMKKMEQESKSDVGGIPDFVGDYPDMDFGVCIPYPPQAEINLWKRRSMAPPMALDLKPRHLGLDMREPMTV